VDRFLPILIGCALCLFHCDGEGPLKEVFIQTKDFQKVSRSAASEILATNKNLAALIDQSPNYIAVQRTRKRITIDEKGYFIIEGDVLLDEDEGKLYARSLDQPLLSFPKAAPTALLGSGTDQYHVEIIVDSRLGKPVAWEHGKTLTYAVARSKFSSESRYAAIVQNMNQATHDWEATCGVKFLHKAELDDKSHLVDENGIPIGVTFLVEEHSGGDFYALSFFPNDPGHRRKLIISNTYFSGGMEYDAVGVLRHEIGHILGFRHEHIRPGAPRECPGESTVNTIPQTEYTTNSVMHYLCGGSGDKRLRITDTDRAGAQKIYGLPFTEIIYSK
jgi:hypothetical protein